MLQGFLNALDIKPVVIGEELILGCHHGKLHVGRNIFVVDIITPEAVALNPVGELRNGDGWINPLEQNDIGELRQKEEEQKFLGFLPESTKRRH